MTMLRNLFNRVGARSNARFDRYYGDVARAGVGYPTADRTATSFSRMRLSASSTLASGAIDPPWCPRI